MRPFLSHPFFVFQKAYLAVHSATHVDDGGARTTGMSATFIA